MNKSVLVILSIALFAHSILSCATPKQCLDISNTTCCVQNAMDDTKTCQQVTVALLKSTAKRAGNIQTPAEQKNAKDIKHFLAKMKAGDPLVLDRNICKAYNSAQLAVASICD